MTKKIFISYRSIERDIAKELIDVIDSLGDYEIWYDGYLVAGEVWWGRIVQKLREADVVIVMLSAAYLASEACQLERDYAHALNKPIIPIRIESNLNITETGEFALIQITNFYVDSKQIEALKLALETAQSQALPVPLPVPPDPPISPLVEIREILKQQELSKTEQRRLLDDLRWHAIERSDEIADTIGVLDIFLRHPSLLVTIRAEIEKLLAELKSGGIKPLSQIQDLITQSHKLTFHEQKQILNDLKLHRINPQETENVDALLKLFIKRPELEQTVRTEVKAMLSMGAGINVFVTLFLVMGVIIILLIMQQIDILPNSASSKATETQAAINTSDAQTQIAINEIATSNYNATQTRIVLDSDDATASAEASQNELASQDAFDMQTQNALATQAQVANLQMTADAQVAINSTATAEAQATREANDSSATADANTSNEQSTQDAINASATANALSTQEANTATVNAQDAINSTATAYVQATHDTRATLTAMPTPTPAFTNTPTATLLPYQIALEDYADEWENAIRELREIGIIGTRGRLIFEEDTAFVQGQGNSYLPLGVQTSRQNVVLSAEIQLFSDSTELEFCALQVRVEQNEAGVAATNIIVGLINTDRLFWNEFLNGEYLDGQQATVTADVHETHFLMIVALNNNLMVYLDGVPIIQNAAIDQQNGSFGLSLLGQTSSSRCEANNIWAYEVQN